MIKYCIIVFLILMKCVIYGTAFSYPQLQLVNVIFRHGDREPNDKTNGDLTNEGRRRAFELGAILRTRYNDFLGEIYKPTTISARSTEYSRTKMSLQLVLAGLYVPGQEQRWHPSLAWQPIPFSYVPEHDDLLLLPKFCPRFQRERERLESIPEFQKLLDPYRDMLNNLTVLTGEQMKNSWDMFKLYHKLTAMRSMNKTLPLWANNIFPDGKLLYGTYLEYDVLRYTDWMRRVNAGTLIRKIVNDMLNKTDDTWSSDRKLFLYSGHELNIASALQTLKIWQPHIPEYTSAVIIELREDRKNYYVKVIYYLGMPETFKEMQIPGCPSLCPLARFIELISDQLPAYDELICDDKPVRLDNFKIY